MFRRLFLPVLTVLLVAGTVVPASAARRAGRGHKISRVTVEAEGRGSLIAVTYGGTRHHVSFLHSVAAIDRVALRDVDDDGEPDILAAPHDGRLLLLWRNQGHGRFALAALPRDSGAVPIRGPRFVLFHGVDDGSPWGEVRYDAAMPRAPSIAAVVAVALLRVPLVSLDPPVPFGPLSGRAPPSA